MLSICYDAFKAGLAGLDTRAFQERMNIGKELFVAGKYYEAGDEFKEARKIVHSRSLPPSRGVHVGRRYLAGYVSAETQP